MDAYSNHYRTSGYAKFPQERRTAGSAQLPMLSVKQESHDFSDPAVDEFVIAAARKTSMEFSWDIGDGWTPPARVGDNSLHVVPTNTAARIRANGFQDMLFVVVPRTAEKRFLEPAGLSLDALTARNTSYFRAPTIVKRLDLLWNLGHCDAPSELLRADAALIEVLSMLHERSARRLSGSPPHRGGLAPAALKKAMAMLEEGIESPRSMDDIASAIGLSPFHFMRAFRQSTGMPPHRWQLARRLERAQALLRSTSRSVTQIALDVGYESGQALARAFKQHIGLSPLGYREGSEAR